MELELARLHLKILEAKAISETVHKAQYRYKNYTQFNEEADSAFEMGIQLDNMAEKCRTLLNCMQIKYKELKIDSD